ncbi:uncharacterized protein LOC122070297 [Macadamia integrifolia]|uniref:uncharacterized protein LOC122070297 n=1 Tax=Macadamia integrifolia TaxID=60698 RepID=UPI001C4F16FA|nr:uncharacterized protein LOC122070297 [Macadamia integrifolia]
MGSENSLSLDKMVFESSEDLKIIQWEDLEQELSRLWSLSSSLNKSKEKKSSLQQKLQSLIQVRAESLSRSNELEDRRQLLEARKLAMDNMLTGSKLVAEDMKKREEQLTVEIRSLLIAGKALSVASKQLQVTAIVFGYVHMLVSGVLEDFLHYLMESRPAFICYC